MHFIYQITNTKNNKIYLGQTNNLKQRWAQYKSFAKNHNGEHVIVRALIKYGIKNFTFEPIATCLPGQDINELEVDMIAAANSRDPNIGYNIDAGGKNYPRSPETAQKISIGLLKHYETNSNWNKGGTLSEEWKRNISIASIGKDGTNTGKTFDDDWVLKISQSNLGKESKSTRRFNDEQEAEICRKYVEDEMSTYALGKEYKASRALILTILERAKITTRKNNYKGHSNNRNALTAEQEKESVLLFKNNNITITKLAKQFGCAKNTMRAILLRNGVEFK